MSGPPLALQAHYATVSWRATPNPFHLKLSRCCLLTSFYPSTNSEKWSELDTLQQNHKSYGCVRWKYSSWADAAGNNLVVRQICYHTYSIINMFSMFPSRKATRKAT